MNALEFEIDLCGIFARKAYSKDRGKHNPTNPKALTKLLQILELLPAPVGHQCCRCLLPLLGCTTCFEGCRGGSGECCCFGSGCCLQRLHFSPLFFHRGLLCLCWAAIPIQLASIFGGGLLVRWVSNFQAYVLISFLAFVESNFGSPKKGCDMNGLSNIIHHLSRLVPDSLKMS